MILSLLELVSERYIAYSSRFVGEFSSWTMDAVQLRTNKSDVFKKIGLGACRNSLDMGYSPTEVWNQS